MVALGQIGCIWAKLVLFRQRGCLRASVCIWAKVWFQAKSLYSVKIGSICANWLYSGKVVVSWQNGCIPAKLLYLG